MEIYQQLLAITRPPNCTARARLSESILLFCHMCVGMLCHEKDMLPQSLLRIQNRYRRFDAVPLTSESCRQVCLEVVCSFVKNPRVSFFAVTGHRNSSLNPCSLGWQCTYHIPYIAHVWEKVRSKLLRRKHDVWVFSYQDMRSFSLLFFFWVQVLMLCILQGRMYNKSYKVCCWRYVSTSFPLLHVQESNKA